MPVTTRLQTMRAAEVAATQLVTESVGTERRSATRPSQKDTLSILREMARPSAEPLCGNKAYQLLLETEILQEQVVSGPCPGMIYIQNLCYAIW